jgi:undecaprenyl-diphosphatase
MDESIFFLINRYWVSPKLDMLMAIASSYDFWIPIIWAIALVCLWRGGAKLRLWLASLVLTLCIVSTITDSLKKFVHRPRPFQALAGVRRVDLDRHTKPRILAIDKPLEITFSPAPKLTPDDRTGRSFPSGHTTNNFAVATILILAYRRIGWCYVPVAALVAYSRIYVGAHWPSDVIVSSIYGIGLGLLCAALSDALWNYVGPRWFPNVWEQVPTLYARCHPTTVSE